MCSWKIFKQCFGCNKKPAGIPLICFDFEGIIAEGDDVQEVMRSIPTEEKFNNFVVDDGCFMQGENEAKLDQAIQSLTLTDGMRELIETMYRKGAKLIIISNSVDFVIEKFLENKGLKQYFTQIFARKARFNSKDILEVQANLRECHECKANVISSFRALHMSDNCKTVAFVGEGRNGYCTVMKLNDQDLVCIRKDSTMDVHLKQCPMPKVKPKLFYWTNGFELLKELEQN